MEHKIKVLVIDRMMILCILILLASMMIMMSCSEDEMQETEMEKTGRLLQSATWQINKLMVDGTDQTSLYANLTLKIAAGTYTSSGGEPVWPLSGTWALTDGSSLKRDKDLAIEISALDESTLVLKLQWAQTAFKSGRVESIKGSHTFEFKKK